MLAGSIEHGAVDESALIVDEHLLVGLGHLAGAHSGHLILQTAGQHLHAVALGVLCQELAAGIAVGSPQLLLLGSLVGSLLCLEVLLGIGLAEHRAVAEQGIGEASEELVGHDGVGRVLKLAGDAGQHTLTQLPGNIETSLIGLLARVVASLNRFLESTHEVGHVGRVDPLLLSQEGDEAVGEAHAGSIADGVAAARELHGLGCGHGGSLLHSLLLGGISRIQRGTRHEGECQQNRLLHYFLGLTSRSSILKISAEKGLMSPCSRSP